MNHLIVARVLESPTLGCPHIGLNRIKDFRCITSPRTDSPTVGRAKLKAMEKAGISKEQYEQLKMEAQETAENLLLFSADIGKEMSRIEQTKGNRYSLPSTSGSTKSQAIHNMGFTDRQARDFQTLAKHPEVVEQAKSVLIPR